MIELVEPDDEHKNGIPVSWGEQRIIFNMLRVLQQSDKPWLRRSLTKNLYVSEKRVNRMIDVLVQNGYLEEAIREDDGRTEYRILDIPPIPENNPWLGMPNTNLSAHTETNHAGDRKTGTN